MQIDRHRLKEDAIPSAAVPIFYLFERIVALIFATVLPRGDSTFDSVL